MSFQRTFDGRTIHLSEMSQQHLSNAYYFFKMRGASKESHLDVYMYQINNRFNGELLPYRPKVNFPQEIRYLENHGYLKGNEVWFEGEKIGEIDDKLINDITDLE